MDDNEWQGSIESSVLVEAVSEVTELVADLLEEITFSYDSELELMIQDIEEALAQDTTLTADEREQLAEELEIFKLMVSGDDAFAVLYEEIKQINDIFNDYEQVLSKGNDDQAQLFR